MARPDITTADQEPAMSEDERKGLPSCSEAHRIMACPGYLRAKVQWEHIEEKDTTMAEAGERTHGAIECLIDGKPVDIPITQRDEFIAVRCVEMQDKLKAELFTDPTKLTKHWKEIRLWLKDTQGNQIMSGKPDYFATDGEGTWFLTDPKTGPKPVPVATKNWQIQAYLSLIAHSDLLKELPFKKAYGAILQPLVSSHAVVVEMSLDDCVSIRQQLMRAIWSSQKRPQPRIPGDHCNYCPVRHLCPQAQAMGLVLAHKFSVVESLSNEQLLALFPKMIQVIEIAENVKDEFKRRVGLGEIEGYELYDHPTGHTVDHPNDLWKLVKEYFSDGKEFSSLLTVPISKIRDVWVSRFSDTAECTKTEAVAAWKEQIEPHLIAKPPQKRVRPVREVSDSK